MHPSITIYFKFNWPIHTFPFQCIILLVVSHTAPTLMRKSQSYCILSSDNRKAKIISNFQFWLETDKAFTSNIAVTITELSMPAAAKLRDHTYIMIQFSQNQFSSHLQISKAAPVLIWNGCLDKKSSWTHTFSYWFSYNWADRQQRLATTAKAASIFLILYMET